MDNVGQVELHRFSDMPRMHYVFAIGITTLLKTAYFAYQTYQCVNNASKDYDCKWSGAGAIAFGPASVFWSELFGLCAFYAAVLALCFLVLEAPVYVLACHVGRRYGIRRNFAGVVYWMSAWMLAFLGLAGIGSFFDPRHVPWAVDRNVGSTFAVLGLLCGALYCAFAFLDRE